MEDTKEKVNEKSGKTDREIWESEVRAFKEGIEAQEAERKAAAEAKKAAAKEGS